MEKVNKRLEGDIALDVDSETKRKIKEMLVMFKEYKRLLRIYNKVKKVRTKKKLINRIAKLV